MTISEYISRITRDYPAQMAWVILFSLVAAVLEVVGIASIFPLLSALLSERLALSGPVGDFFAWSGIATLGTYGLLALVVGLMVAKSVLQGFSIYQAERIGILIEQDLRNRLSEGFLKARWRYHLEERSGRVLQTIMREAELVLLSTQFLGSYLSLTVILAVFLVVILASSFLKFLITGVLAVGLVALIFHVHRLSQQVAEERILRSHDLNSTLIENVTLAKFIKASGVEASRFRAGQALIAQLARLGIRNAQLRVFMGHYHEGFGAILVGTSCIITLHFQLATPDELILFLLLLYRTFNRFGALQVVRRDLITVIPSFAACHALLEETARHEEREDGEPVPPRWETIALQGVTFGFDQRDSAPLFAGLDLEVRQGEFLALVGPSGSGKTTITDLIMGLFDPQEGRVVVDGTPLEALSLRGWRGRIGFVPQDPFLLNDSIVANIRLGNPEASADDVSRALRLAHLDEFVKELPQGFDTVVGERGAKLSGGQKQRIAIARALVRNPQVLVLDEATSALDHHSEKWILRTLEELKGRMAIVMVAHRKSTVMAADRVAVVSRGRVVQTGPPAELAGRAGPFRELYLESLAAGDDRV